VRTLKQIEAVVEYLKCLCFPCL